MRFILAFDDALLKFFGKIARAFARLTGRSNFFLAKCMLVIVMAGMMVGTLNYWFPVLGRKTSALTTGINGFSVFLIALWYFPKCDRAEKTANHEVRMFSPLLYSPLFRVVITYVAILDGTIHIFRSFFADEFLFAKLIDSIVDPAFAAFLYFAALDPPRVDKSKIREWAEGFANLFRKPAAVPIKK